MSGFGPSTGRLVEVGESSETRISMKTKPMPPVIGALAFAAVFLGVIFGMTSICEDEEMLGAILLITTAALVVLMVIWTIRAPEKNPDE
jgi:hypothetical protein